MASSLDHMPTITVDDLKDHAARALTEAAAMYAAVKKVGETPEDLIDILAGTIRDCVTQCEHTASIDYEDNPELTKLELAENMHTYLRTIAAASLALVPLYEAVVEVRRRNLIQVVN